MLENSQKNKKSGKVTSKHVFNTDLVMKEGQHTRTIRTQVRRIRIGTTTIVTVEIGTTNILKQFNKIRNNLTKKNKLARESRIRVQNIPDHLKYHPLDTDQLHLVLQRLRATKVDKGKHHCFHLDWR